MHDPKKVEKEVAALGGLRLSELRERWEELYGAAPPKALREGFLVKACAYKIQEKAHGGLSKATRRRLRKIAEDVSAGKPVGVSSPRRIKPGTRLVRAWGGTVHTVTVVAGGFEYEGTRYTDPPPLNWSILNVSGRRTEDGQQASQTRRDCLEAAPG